MNRLVACMAAVAALTLAAGVALGELTPDKEKEARALIAQFTAAEFAVRQAAVDKLIDMGPDVLPMVEKTLAETADAEVKLRCQMVVKGIKLKFPPPKPPEAPLPANFFEPAKVSVNAKATLLGDVMATLRVQSGNFPLQVVPTAEGKRPVTVTVKDKPYWQALDEVCRSAGVVYYVSPAGIRQMLQIHSADGPPEDPRTYVGPVVVWAARTERGGTPHKVRSFRSDPNPGRADTNLRGDDDKPDKLRLRLHFGIENHNPVIEGFMTFTKISAADGSELATPEVIKPHYSGPSFFGIRSAFQSGAVTIDCPADTKGPLKVEGIVHAVYAVGKKEARFPDAFGGERPTVNDGDLDMTLERTSTTGRDTVVTITVRSAGKGGNLMPAGDATGYGFALVDPKGETHSDIRGWRTNVGSVEITFDRIPHIDDTWSLVYTYPAQFAEKDFPFVLKDVLLP